MSFMIFCTTILSLLILIQSKSYSPSEIPNPSLTSQDASACGREDVSSSSICDPDHLLTKEHGDVLEGFINDTPLAQIGVLVISSMSKSFIGSKSIDDACKIFAVTVHNKWGIGEITSQNGVLIFLSIEDRAFYISTGDKFLNILDRFTIDAIFDGAKPFLRKGRIGPALEHVVVGVTLEIKGEKRPSSSNAHSQSHSQHDKDRESESDVLSQVMSGVCILGLIFSPV